ncbi:MAG: DUF4434 domain-containing protein [Candidatus Omnitrophota bacterium]
MGLEKHERARTFVKVLLIVVIIAQVVISCFAKPWKNGPVPLDGTFIQLTSVHLAWKVEQWRELFLYFREMELKHLIVQWIVYDGISFFDNPFGLSPLEIILGLADAEGMTVSVGLAMDTAYWQKIGGDPDEVNAYLDDAFVLSRQTAIQVNEMAGRHPSFQGWYIPQEVDNVHWMKAQRRRILSRYLRDLCSSLRSISPDKSVSVSGFANSEVNPEALERFWTKLLTETKVDTVLFQDGIGAGNIGGDETPAFLGPVLKAAKAAGCEFHVIIEVFQQIAGLPINDDYFQAVPASWQRVHRQLEIGASGVDSLIAFSVPEYMTPIGGEKAENLYRSYLQFIHEQGKMLRLLN